jgi:hypothetical protein
MFIMEPILLEVLEIIQVGVVLEFIIDATGRVRIYVNNTLVYTYSTNRLANGPTFPDYSGWSANNPHIDSTFVYGPTVNKKRFYKSSEY